MVNGPIPYTPRASARTGRWRCKVPRCGATGDGDVSDWRRHYVDTHMTL